MCVCTSFRDRGEEEEVLALLAAHQYKGDCVILDGGVNVGGYSRTLLSAFKRISKTCRIINYEMSHSHWRTPFTSLRRPQLRYIRNLSITLM